MGILIPMVEGYLGKYSKRMCGFPCRYSTRRGGKQSLVLFFNSDMLCNVPGIATMAAPDPDTGCNVHTAPLLAPQMKLQGRTLGRRRQARVKKTKCMLYIYIYLQKYVHW